MISISQKLKNLLVEIESSREEDRLITITRIGRKFEQEFLGFTLPDETDLFFRPNEYLSFQEAMEKMKDTQPVGYNPNNPTGGCNAKFWERVNFFLGAFDRNLRLYISVGTEMDFFHGTDAVFTWREAFVTIDVTVDSEKKYKADFRILPDDVESGSVYEFVARDIALLLTSRYLQVISNANVS